MIENKGSGSEKSQRGCDSLYKKQIRIGAPGIARPSTPRKVVSRVLWRRDRIVVYQDMTGRYWWADLEQGKQRPVVIGGKANAVRNA